MKGRDIKSRLLSQCRFRPVWLREEEVANQTNWLRSWPCCSGWDCPSSHRTPQEAVKSWRHTQFWYQTHFTFRPWEARTSQTARSSAGRGRRRAGWVVKAAPVGSLSSLSQQPNAHNDGPHLTGVWEMKWEDFSAKWHIVGTQLYALLPLSKPSSQSAQMLLLPEAPCFLDAPRFKCKADESMNPWRYRETCSLLEPEKLILIMQEKQRLHYEHIDFLRCIDYFSQAFKIRLKILDFYIQFVIAKEISLNFLK